MMISSLEVLLQLKILKSRLSILYQLMTHREDFFVVRLLVLLQMLWIELKLL